MNKVKIYVFADKNGFPRYVGKTKISVKHRHKQHLRDRFRYKSYFYNWLNGVISREELYSVILLDEVEEIGWEDRECFWIKHFREIGYPITNMTDGGDGNNNQIFSKESSKKRIESRKWYKHSDETKKKLSEAHTGKKLSQVTKDKLRDYFKGTPCPEHVKKALSKAVLQFTEEGVFIKEFNSLTEAAIEVKTSKGAIQNVCAGRQKRAGGYKWKYKN